MGLTNNSLSDVVMILLRKKLKECDYVGSFEENNIGNCSVTTKEGIEYTCYMTEEKNKREYCLYNKHFQKCSKLSSRAMGSKYFDPNIIPDIFEDFILKTEILYKAFKEGIEAFKVRTNNYDIITVLNNEQYLQYVNEHELNRLVYFLWNKGYEFSTKFPDPNVIHNQYEYLKRQALEKVDIDKIKELMLRHKDLHIYLDEDIPERIAELKNVKEIEYSYGHIVAKAKTYDLKMNLLPLDGVVLVFDTDGVNEIARCDVGDYSKKYENKALSEMSKAIRNFELENSIEFEKYDEKEKEENEQEE